LEDMIYARFAYIDRNFQKTEKLEG
jgi:hypothetical protein